MSYNEKYFLMIFGSVLVIIGLVLFARKGAIGKNRIKIFGFEFELSAPSLVIFVLGFVMILFPFLISDNNEPIGAYDPKNPEVNKRGKKIIQDQLAGIKRDINLIKKTNNEIVNINIGGNWQSAEGIKYFIQQIGNSIIFQEFNPIYGVTTAAGRGLLSGNNLNISITTFLGATGNLNMNISNNGRQMSGYYHDFTTNAKMPLIISR